MKDREVRKKGAVGVKLPTGGRNIPLEELKEAKKNEGRRVDVRSDMV